MQPGSYFKKVFDSNYYYQAVYKDSYIGIDTFDNIVFEKFIKGWNTKLLIFYPSSLRIDQMKILFEICNAKW